MRPHRCFLKPNSNSPELAEEASKAENGNFALYDEGCGVISNDVSSAAINFKPIKVSIPFPDYEGPTAQNGFA